MQGACSKTAEAATAPPVRRSGWPRIRVRPALPEGSWPLDSQHLLAMGNGTKHVGRIQSTGYKFERRHLTCHLRHPNVVPSCHLLSQPSLPQQPLPLEAVQAIEDIPSREPHEAKGHCTRGAHQWLVVNPHPSQQATRAFGGDTRRNCGGTLEQTNAKQRNVL